MTPPPLILGIDPSLTGTGYALSRGRELIDAGVCRPRGADKACLDARLDELRGDVEGVFDAIWTTHGTIGAVVIEYPQTTTKPGRASVCTYAMAVGAVRFGVPWRAHAGHLFTPSASDWTRGFPGTAGDKNKTKRIALVERTFRVKLEKGSGDAADAALLTVWGAGVLKTEELMKRVAG